MHLKMSSAKWRPFCLGPNVFGSGKGFLPDSTKPLPDPILSYLISGLCGINIRPFSQEVLNISTHKMSLKNALVRLLPRLSWASVFRDNLKLIWIISGVIPRRNLWIELISPSNNKYASNFEPMWSNELKRKQTTDSRIFAFKKNIFLAWAVVFNQTPMCVWSCSVSFDKSYKSMPWSFCKIMSVSV